MVMAQNHSTDAIDLLTKLVSIPSPSQREAKAASYLAGWLNAHGLNAHVDEAGNAVGVKGNGPHEILLLGHIDTFSGDVPQRRVEPVEWGSCLCLFIEAGAELPDLQPQIYSLLCR